ncbi:hypothetical protein V8G54_001138 [Vigna mungo]|uniref:Uncharacterized protein n=1 Tax=Vigna mungo TaxID=3915 RepID=A0AAQ3SBI4_VIGMU
MNRSHFLPSVKNLGCTLFKALGNCKNSHSWWHRNQLYLPPKKDAKASTSTSSYCPKQVFPHGFPVKNSAIGINNFSIYDIIHPKTILSHHASICSSCNVPSNA